MPLLSLYINNKAGGLIYHQVHAAPPYTAPRSQHAPTSMLCFSKRVPRLFPLAFLGFAGLCEPRRQAGHQRPPTSRIDLHWARKHHEAAVAGSRLVADDRARGRRLRPAVL